MAARAPPLPLYSYFCFGLLPAFACELCQPTRPIANVLILYTCCAGRPPCCRPLVVVAVVVFVCMNMCRWIALPEDAQEEAAAASGTLSIAADGPQPLDLYGEGRLRWCGVLCCGVGCVLLYMCSFNTDMSVPRLLRHTKRRWHTLQHKRGSQWYLAPQLSCIQSYGCLRLCVFVALSVFVCCR